MVVSGGMYTYAIRKWVLILAATLTFKVATRVLYVKDCSSRWLFLHEITYYNFTGYIVLNDVETR
jgi:hypothetical protein